MDMRGINLVEELRLDELTEFLSHCVKGKLNILITGETCSGKTTVLNALCQFIPQDEKVAVIEYREGELKLSQEHTTRFAVKDLTGEGEDSIKNLLKKASDMKPDRIIIGECIADEALDILRMMEAGHNVMFTMGSCHPENDVYGLRLLMRLAKRNMSEKEALKMIAKNMDLIIHVVNKRIVAVAEVGGITEDGTLGLFDVFNFPAGKSPPVRVGMRGGHCLFSVLPIK